MNKNLIVILSIMNLFNNKWFLNNNNPTKSNIEYINNNLKIRRLSPENTATTTSNSTATKPDSDNISKSKVVDSIKFMGFGSVLTIFLMFFCYCCCCRSKNKAS